MPKTKGHIVEPIVPAAMPVPAPNPATLDGYISTLYNRRTMK